MTPVNLRPFANTVPSETQSAHYVPTATVTPYKNVQIFKKNCSSCSSLIDDIMLYFNLDTCCFELAAGAGGFYCCALQTSARVNKELPHLNYCLLIE